VSILIAVYGGALAVASPVCGWAADQTSNRRVPMLFGLIALAGATVLLQTGETIAILMLGRVLQGISAAVVWVVGLALLVDTVPQAELGQAMGLVFLAMSLGVLAGPLFGGLLFEKAGYNAVFAMAYGFIGLDVLLRVLMVENKALKTTTSSTKPCSTPENESSAQASTSFKNVTDSKDNMVTVQLSELSRSLSELGPEKHKDLPPQPAKKQAAILVLLKSRRLLSCLWGVMIVATLGAQFDSVLPIFLNKTFGWTSIAAGLTFLPISLTAFLSPIVGWGVDRFGPRWFTVSGFVTLAIFEAVLGIVRHNNIGQKVLLCSLLALIGISFDLTITPLLVEIMAVVDAKEKQEPGIFGSKGAMAQAYGLFNFAWALGSLVGPLWAGFANERAGWQAMTASLAITCVVTAIPATIWTGGSVFQPEKRKRDKKVDTAEKSAEPKPEDVV
jgi:MFS family permease